jgi:hypothetical protein
MYALAVTRLAGIEVFEMLYVWVHLKYRKHIITTDNTDLQGSATGSFQDAAACLGAGHGTESSGVCDQLALTTRRPIGSKPSHNLDKIMWIAGLGIAFSLQGKNGHRDLCQIIHRQVIQIGYLSKDFFGRRRAISPKGLRVTDPDRLAHTSLACLFTGKTLFATTPRAVDSHIRVASGAMMASTQPLAAP